MTQTERLRDLALNFENGSLINDALHAGADALDAKPDLAVVETLRRALEAAITQLSDPCTCHEGYTCRQMIDPECRFHEWRYLVEEMSASLASPAVEQVRLEWEDLRKACAANAEAWRCAVNDGAVLRGQLLAELGLTEQQLAAETARANRAEAELSALRECHNGALALAQEELGLRQAAEARADRAEAGESAVYQVAMKYRTDALAFLDRLKVLTGAPRKADLPETIKSLIEAKQAAEAEVARLKGELQTLRELITPAFADSQHKMMIENLAMFVRRLYARLRKHDPDAVMIRQANTYLKAIGQAGTPLRAEESALQGEGDE